MAQRTESGTLPEEFAASGGTPRTTATAQATSSAARSARHAGHAGRGAHADRLPRERRRDGQRPPGDRGRRARLRPLHAVRRLQLRCPNTLFTGDFYRFRTRTVDLVKAMRRSRSERDPPAGLAALERAHRRAEERAVLEREAGVAGARGRLGRRARTPGRRRDRALLRLRGRFPPDLAAAGGRADPREGRRRVRAHAGAVVLRRAGRRDGLRRPGAHASPSTTSPTGGRSGRSASSSSTPTTTSRSPRTTPATSATTTTSRSSSSSSSSRSSCATASCSFHRARRAVVTYHDACRLNKRKGIHEAPGRSCGRFRASRSRTSTT